MCKKEMNPKKDFNVKVNKSEVVAAVLPMQEHWLPLSNLDLLLPPLEATRLKCGGIIVGCTFDHRVADAYSANLFLVSWSELAQCKPLSQLPSFRRSFLFPRHPGYYDDSINDLYVPISTLPPTKPEILNPNDQVISRIYYVTGDKTEHLQSLTNCHDQKSTKYSQRSKLESFSAFLWKTIASGINKETSGFSNFRFGIVVDGRTRLISNNVDVNNQDKSLKGYFGNILSIPFEEKKVEELKEKSLNWVANVIHEFLDIAKTQEHFLGLIDWVEAHRPEPSIAKIYAMNGDGPAVVVSSGQHFPAKNINFGWVNQRSGHTIFRGPEKRDM
ncbi:hypothetical protein MTR67_011325 [Solanum verrucosum]|uniref:Uncharacterized protein n=1 Tax=Solanum verrucosum TaxID=315347 RepID=A0AAF0QAT7_SOLVR|nr:hypothetical protein MTR67_011325 [Solanum verrucosum]